MSNPRNATTPFNAFAGEHYINLHGMVHRITVDAAVGNVWMVDATEYAAKVTDFEHDHLVNTVTDRVDITEYRTSRSAFEAGLQEVLSRH